MEKSVNRQKKVNSSAGKAAEEWTMPVSRKYYMKLKAKVERIYLDLGHLASRSALVMIWIDLYLTKGEKPTHIYTDEDVMCVFFSLRQEIDEAIRRSALARQRAAERRARKEAEMQAKEAQKEVRKDDKVVDGVGNFPESAAASPRSGDDYGFEKAGFAPVDVRDGDMRPPERGVIGSGYCSD